MIEKIGTIEKDTEAKSPEKSGFKVGDTWDFADNRC